MVFGPELVYNSLLLTANCFLDALSLKIFSDFFSVKGSHQRCFFRIVIHDYWKLGIFISSLDIIIIKYSAHSILNLIKICGKGIVFEYLDTQQKNWTKYAWGLVNLPSCPRWHVISIQFENPPASFLNANAVFFPNTNYPFSGVRKEFGIFARRAMVDQAREGLCYQWKLNILVYLTLKRSSVLS